MFPADTLYLVKCTCLFTGVFHPVCCLIKQIFFQSPAGGMEANSPLVILDNTIHNPVLIQEECLLYIPIPKILVSGEYFYLRLQISLVWWVNIIIDMVQIRAPAKQNSLWEAKLGKAKLFVSRLYIVLYSSMENWWSNLKVLLFGGGDSSCSKSCPLLWNTHVGHSRVISCW